MKRLIQYSLSLLVITLTIFGCTKSESAINDGGYHGTETGQAGSMAKFSMSGDHLFLINDSALLVFDVTNEENPVKVSKLNVDFGIETVFTLGGKLFIGSTTGVYIYNIENPSNIIFLSKYEHITSCDPVVANDSLAFATLNSQSMCRWQNGANQLDVIDISNIVYPQLISSLPMQNPKGLGIDGNLVFVCNSEEGVKIFDFTDPQNLKQVSGILGIDAYDLILRDKILFLVGKDGLFQYDYENINQIVPLSNIIF
jgi:hypothetical protein